VCCHWHSDSSGTATSLSAGKLTARRVRAVRAPMPAAAPSSPTESELPGRGAGARDQGPGRGTGRPGRLATAGNLNLKGSVSAACPKAPFPGAAPAHCRALALARRVHVVAEIPRAARVTEARPLPQ
jgi:hypothetical protein